LNLNDIKVWLQQNYGKTAVVATINGKSSPRDQIELFAKSGLLISSHSSQLINVMFSHPRSAMIEVTPEFHNSDFSEYAHGMGVFFQYALGGKLRILNAHHIFNFMVF
jgi:hypothetical protein